MERDPVRLPEGTQVYPLGKRFDHGKEISEIDIVALKKPSHFIGLLHKLQNDGFGPKTLVGQAEYLLREDLITYEEFVAFFAKD